MKKSIKLSIFLILVLAIALSVFGCAKKTPKKQAEKKLTDSDIEKLFEMERVSGGWAIRKYRGESGNVTIPSTYKGGKIIEIIEEAFAENSYINKINVEANLKKIGEEAFSKSSLKELRILGTVEKIGDDAFSECKYLETVTLNRGLREIGEGAFKKTIIGEIAMPSTVEKIGDGAFYGCKYLRTATLNEGLREIEGRRLFLGHFPKAV